MSEFRRRDESEWDDSERAWKERTEFVRSILDWPRFRRIQPVDKGEVVSRVYLRAFEFTRTRVPDNERGWLTQIALWEANRPRPKLPPEPKLGAPEPIAPPDEDSNERSVSDRVIELATPAEIRFMFRTFFRRFAQACLDLFEASLEFGGLSRHARSCGEKEATIAQRWKRCRTRVMDYVGRNGLDGLLRLMHGEHGA